MTGKALDVISRGSDSSGRAIRGTRQFFQFFDRLNAGPANDLLVIVQGGFMGSAGAGASAGTHGQAMCADFRTWNLSTAVREATQVEGRKMMGTMWYRNSSQGFDPHIHNNLIGDSPADSLAIAQVQMYRNGANGLGSGQYRDDFWFRPKTITNYQYLPEDDMFEPADRQRLNTLHGEVTEMREVLDQFKNASWKRDTALKAKVGKVITLVGQEADLLGRAINAVDDEGLKKELRDGKRQVLETLRDLEFVDGKDNPSDDALNEI